MTLENLESMKRKEASAAARFVGKREQDEVQPTRVVGREMRETWVGRTRLRGNALETPGHNEHEDTQTEASSKFLATAARVIGEVRPVADPRRAYAQSSQTSDGAPPGYVRQGNYYVPISSAEQPRTDYGGSHPSRRSSEAVRPKYARHPSNGWQSDYDHAPLDRVPLQRPSRRLRSELICPTVSRDETSSEGAKNSIHMKMALEPHVRKAQFLSNKRHKCPYCSAEFTRHHSLKSHLLTHSQEKPYVCQTCDARYRRLNDLRRHTKLHTGERPHTCDKCGRRFARGDALARHTHGPEGCAARRSSVGGEDDPFGRDGEPWKAWTLSENERIRPIYARDPNV
jgi:DNA-directed RNA polymerase subunit RPC12/RpoP